ncbi:hypothetical protein FSP39_003942 [Pinctada imbricata]|uniref:Major facilitator superfamily (MFS) profile domain-containing protein n=1 Tax=Pinctada imbricata TaxID=66713 RepID=A0AA89BHM5_PINIB|nr:hypothetical protein FSP39_003942 [Pinctada imbricata]
MADSTRGNERGSYKYVVCLCCFAGLGGLTFGYGTAVVSGAMLQIKYQYDLSTIWHEAIVSVTLGAAAMASACSGVLTDRFGRRPVIILSSALFTVGSVVLAITRGDGKLMLLSGRLISGLGIGCSTMVVPLYMAEVSPAAIRGTLLTLYALFVTSGILISSVVAGLFSSDEDNGWRYMFGIGGVPSLLQFIAFFFLPETPSWLVSHGKLEEAKTTLNKIRRSQNNELEFDELKEGALDSNNEEGFWRTLGKMLRSAPVRKALFLGCILQVYQQFCGINTVM